MDQLDVYYRALLEYKKSVNENKDCLKLNNAFLSADADSDKLSVTRAYCTIDEEWVSEIEKGLTFIEKAIKEDRQFILSQGEVVPIEKVKSVSKESVQHLAKHSDLITEYEEGEDIIPDKLYTVERLNDYTVYENRFLYTLLKNLQYFIDKRLKLLNDSKVQTENQVKMESEFNIGKEKVKYEFSLSSTEKTEKKREFKLDEDTSQMDLIQRVERLRLILYDFQNSQLIKSLNGCTLVRPPIMRTNVILKNPNFKKVMELWTFIEMYNDAGLTIQVMEEEELPSEEYMQEMFNISLINYYLFNHHIKPEKTLEKAMPVSKEFKPNLVRRTVEEFIDEFSMDIDDIERIFIDKVKKATKKRKENEQKIKKAIDRVLKKERNYRKRLVEQEKKRLLREQMLAKKAEEKAQKALLAAEEKAKRAEMLLEEKAKKAQMAAEEKARKAQMIADEKARKIAEKEAAIQAKELLKEKVKTNFELIKKIIIENYPKAKIQILNENEFDVHQTIGNLLLVKSKDYEYKIIFKGNESFINEFNERYPELISVDKSRKGHGWYKLVDKATLGEDELKAIVCQTFEYDKQLRKEKAEITRAKTKQLKEKKLDQTMISEIIEQIKNHIRENYKNVSVKGNEKYIKISRKRIVMNTLQIKGYFIRLDFPSKKAFVGNLFERFPNHIEKLGKRKHWYKLIVNGEFTIEDILSIIDNSFKYLADAEEKALKLEMKRQEEEAKKQALENEVSDKTEVTEVNFEEQV